ncbi:MAG: type I-E CRISPR-associated protein Cas6/Cse3/CasE, partial [Lentilactobacillus parabuchneri]|nr:type I-E CRISPR-associated protein Cas6/Cse3/CasE [Lentilactobacillus parabuchneri]
QRQWLADRAEKHGFQLVQTTLAGASDSEAIDNFDIVSRDWPVLHKGKRNMKLSRVTFEGLLRVSQLDDFKQLLVTGIGREKAFGMGLMTVIPRG